MTASHATISTSPPPPLISVLMPVYNAAAYLDKALDSLLAQSFSDFECICVDDGSTDHSLAVLEDCAKRDPRIRVISRPNTGIVGALNDALAAARGRFIARMDADDWCTPDRFEKQVHYLQQHADCVAVGTWCTRTDPYGSPTGTLEPPLDHETIDAALLRGDGTVIVHATLLMRGQTLRTIGGWQPRYNWVEDLDLFLRLAEHGRVANLPEHLYAYRRHATSVCYVHNETMRDRFKEVVRDAYLRRGISAIPDLDALRPELAAGHTVAELYRNWACHAIHRGAANIARKHAARAVYHAPWSLQSWRVMYWAMAG